MYLTYPSLYLCKICSLNACVYDVYESFCQIEYSDIIQQIFYYFRFLSLAPVFLLCMASTLSGEPKTQTSICAKGNSICIPTNYSKFDLPNETQTTVSVGIDIKDIPKIDDKDFSVTLNAFFVVRWKDTRLVIDQERIDEILGPDTSQAH